MIRSLAALLLAAALLAGCGSSKKKNTSSSTAPASGGGGKASGGTTVSMKNIQFSPKSLSVKVGDTVTWTNDDSVDHNVIASAFKSGNFGNGKSFSWKATKAGTFKYACTIHPGMDGTLTVTQ
jgi:plastocyanin